MNILFVCSGNSPYFEISPFIKSQGESIKRLGHQVDYFTIKGKGISGYLKNVKKLRKYLKSNNYDIIHAHYTLCALVVLLAHTHRPIVVSYMGNDAVGEFDAKGRFILSSLPLLLISIVIQPFVQAIISKSETTSKYIFRKHSIIPNGVDINLFKPDYNFQKEKSEDKTVLFLGDTKDVGKNFTLLKKAVSQLNNSHINICAPYPIKHSELPKYYSRADVFALCSIFEGSPNVVKEAMACNCPIVSTDVGDVKYLLGDLEGHFIASNDITDFREKLKLALSFEGRTKGRDRLIELGLDSESVAKKIVEIYMSLLNKD